MDSSTLPTWALVRFGNNGSTMITRTSDLKFVGTACKGAGATIELDKVEHKVVVLKLSGFKQEPNTLLVALAKKSIATCAILQREVRAIAEKQDATNLNVSAILMMMTKLCDTMDAKFPKEGRTKRCTERKSKKRKRIDSFHKSWFPQPLPELLYTAVDLQTENMTQETQHKACPLILLTESTLEAEMTFEADPTPEVDPTPEDKSTAELGPRQESEPTPEPETSQPITTLELEHSSMSKLELRQEQDIGPSPYPTHNSTHTVEPTPEQEPEREPTLTPEMDLIRKTPDDRNTYPLPMTVNSEMDSTHNNLFFEPSIPQIYGTTSYTTTNTDDDDIMPNSKRLCIAPLSGKQINIGTARNPVLVEMLRYLKSKQLPNAKRFVLSMMDLVFSLDEMRTSNIEGGIIKYNGVVVEKRKLCEYKLTAIYSRAAIEYGQDIIDLQIRTDIRNAINAKCRSKRRTVMK